MSQESLFCPIRKDWVVALPEEHVRQRLLCHMIEDLGFPSSLIIVEKALRQLPHLSITDRRLIPDRRADILSFTNINSKLNLETAVQDDKVMQGFELESLPVGGDHSQKVKVPSTGSGYGSKDCVNLSSSTAVSRLNELHPLIIIECKAIPLSTNVIKQVRGYNYFVRAPFIAVANQLEVRVGWYDLSLQDYAFIDYLPDYQSLVNSIQ